MRSPVESDAMSCVKKSKLLERAEQSLREGRLEGIIDAPKSGRWGNWVYSMVRTTQRCRTYVVPQDPRTGAQVQTRDVFKTAAQAWRRKLTQEQRDAWNRTALGVWSKRRLGQSGKLLGQQVFTGRSSVLLKLGKEILTWPTARPAFKANPVTGLSVTNGRDGVRIKLSVSGPVEEDIMVFGQAPCSAGRKKWRHGAYLCLLPMPEGGEAEITARYVARFGQPQPGKKVFIRVQQQRTGWEDVAIEFSEVVPAADEVAGRELVLGGASTAPDESNGLNGLHKLREAGRLYGLEAVQVGQMPRQGGGTMEPRCTREWFRIGSPPLPSHCRRGTRWEWRWAGWEVQHRALASGGRRRDWRELWRGS